MKPRILIITSYAFDGSTGASVHAFVSLTGVGGNEVGVRRLVHGDKSFWWRGSPLLCRVGPAILKSTIVDYRLSDHEYVPNTIHSAKFHLGANAVDCVCVSTTKIAERL